MTVIGKTPPSFDDCETQVGLRGRAMFAANPGMFTLNYAFRPLPEQQAEWDRWQADIKHYGSAEKAAAAGCAIAAYPGTSKHGTTKNGKPWAEAIDVACDAKHNALRDREAKRFGFCQPVPGEKWHLQVVANPPPIPTLTKEQALTVTIEPVGSASIAGGGGGWVFGRRGHTYAFGKAKHYGNWQPNEAGPTDHSGRDCVALVPTLTGFGYWLISDIGEVYAYGDAKWTGNYRPKNWGDFPVIGAYVEPTPALPVCGGLCLIRDDDKNLNEYHLPEIKP